jgi:hypothetical protein
MHARDRQEAWRIDPLHGWDTHLTDRPARLHTNPTGNEVERWFADGVIDRKASPEEQHQHLQSKQCDFPIIMQIACDCLAIPATSAPSERVFSMAGNLISKKKTRISSENVRHVLCLRSWGVIVRDDDEEEIYIDEDGLQVTVTL